MNGIVVNERREGGPGGRPRVRVGGSNSRTEVDGWRFESGDQIHDGITAVKLLGGGTRYEAYLAVDEALLSTVVVKVLRPSCINSRSARKGLAAEAAALRTLAHPSIPRCFGSVLEGDRPHLVLEFIEGPRLSTMIRKYKALPLEQLAPLAVELAAALHYLHGREMVHLDVKPQNIIMSAPPKLIDMSIARGTHDAMQIDHPVGTDAYMSPEQCSARPHTIGTPADIWGLGATLWHAATGKRPFPKVRDGYPQLVDPTPTSSTELPRSIAEPLERCMSADPADRPTAAEVAESFEPFLAALPRNPVIGRFRPRSMRKRK